MASSSGAILPGERRIIMFGFISKKKLREYMKEVKDGSRARCLYAKYPPESEKQEKLNCYSQGYEDGTDNMYNAICGKFGISSTEKGAEE